MFTCSSVVSFQFHKSLPVRLIRKIISTFLFWCRKIISHSSISILLCFPLLYTFIVRHRISCFGRKNIFSFLHRHKWMNVNYSVRDILSPKFLLVIHFSNLIIPNIHLNFMGILTPILSYFLWKNIHVIILMNFDEF